MPKRDLEDDIRTFFDIWDGDSLHDFFKDINDSFAAYGHDTTDWEELIPGTDEFNVRLIKTIYMMCKIADKHSGKLCRLKIDLKGLRQRLEKLSLENQPDCVS